MPKQKASCTIVLDRAQIPEGFVPLRRFYGQSYSKTLAGKTRECKTYQALNNAVYRRYINAYRLHEDGGLQYTLWISESEAEAYIEHLKKASENTTVNEAATVEASATNTAPAVESVAEVKKDLNALSEQIQMLRIAHNQTKACITEFQEELHKLRMDGADDASRIIELLKLGQKLVELTEKSNRFGRIRALCPPRNGKASSEMITPETFEGGSDAN